ncbi:hypothetical protein HPB50_020568 [Hyalomma asiaticum]|uniref:Uncharacterized protein n=1 Tax=Hyalomma asiaticum TaxID=266040 RepID=A0ACB7SHR5_HYAAI|nr:hypothetical protein HPB50_020568 [Hyalomma asiaticum]
MRSGAGTSDVPLVKWRFFEAMTPIMEVLHREPILCSNIEFGSLESVQTEKAGSQDAESTPTEADDFQDWPVPDAPDSPVDTEGQTESASRTTER